MRHGHAMWHGIRASTLVERPPATNDVPTKDRLLGRLTDGQTGCVMAIRKHRQKNDHPNPFIFIKHLIGKVESFRSYSTLRICLVSSVLFILTKNQEYIYIYTPYQTTAPPPLGPSFSIRVYFEEEEVEKDIQ